jgi:cysteinyl-tRNA synthetase
LFAQNRRRLLYYYETMEDLKEASEKADQGTFLAGYDQNEFLNEFHRAMSDDFNTGQAIAALNVAMKKARSVLITKDSQLRANTAKSILGSFKQLGAVLGILVSEPKEFITELTDLVLPELKVTREEIADQIDLRSKARDAKNWELSDKIRANLQQIGILLRDHPKGTLWSIEPPSES